MKNQFTFNEMAKVFAQVNKVEESTNRLIEISGKFAQLDRAFDAEFEKYGYTFFQAPQALQDMFEEKCAMLLEKEKAERKAYKAIKEFGELVGIGEGNMDVIEEKVKWFIDNKYYWKAPEMVVRVKHIALDASRKVRCYA